MGTTKSLELPDFQIFIKPVGSRCNLRCSYCYYSAMPGAGSSGYNAKPEAGGSGHNAMKHDILESLIKQQIDATESSTIIFSWHGGEPLLAGIEFFRSAVKLQKKYCPPGRKIINGIQTNGTLINEEWCRFFTKENFMVGLSMDGPEVYHNHYRNNRNGQGSFKKALEGFDLLVIHGIDPEILCVVNSVNSSHPAEVYNYFRLLGVSYLTFIPLVERTKEGEISSMTVPSAEWGKFLCDVFDEWLTHDIGKIKVQIFEEVLKTAFQSEHALCIFKRRCGVVPVIEQNGDFYSCDHYVSGEHLIGNIQLSTISKLLKNESQIDFGSKKSETLPLYCLNCEVLGMCHGECPKNRFIKTPDGEEGLNYLCEGYRKFFNHCRPVVEEVRRVSLKS